jgi:hypothetical protein
VKNHYDAKRQEKLTWLSVNVPVLSLQIVVAEPIVSQAESLLT